MQVAAIKIEIAKSPLKPQPLSTTVTSGLLLVKNAGSKTIYHKQREDDRARKEAWREGRRRWPARFFDGDNGSARHLVGVRSTLVKRASERGSSRF